MQNNETKETDKEFDKLRFIIEPNECEGQRDVVVFGMRDFARKLERERDELKHKIATDYMAGVVIELEAERDAQMKEINQLKTELKTAKIPLCVGKPSIKILAREGQWLSENGNGLIAADCLFKKDPYEEIDQLRKVCDELCFAVTNPNIYRSQEIQEAVQAYNQLPHVKEKK